MLTKTSNFVHPNPRIKGYVKLVVAHGFNRGNVILPLILTVSILDPPWGTVYSNYD